MSRTAYGRSTVTRKSGDDPGPVVKVFRRITDIPRVDWESVYPDVLEGYGFFQSLDKTISQQFSPYYIMVYENGVPVAATTCFLIDYPVETTVQGLLKDAVLLVKRIFPNFFSLRALMCGQPVGQGRIGYAGEGVGRVEIIEDCLEKIAEEEKAAILVFKEFDKSYAPILQGLQRRGYYRFNSLPNTEMTLCFKSFDEYLMSLSYATRYDLKRKFKKADGLIDIDFEIVNDLKDRLNEAYALYMQMVERHSMGLEVMPKDFFYECTKNMPEQTRYFLWSINGKLVAFAMCFVSKDHFLDYYLGLDYTVAHDYHLYFVRFRDLMKWCIENGIKTYSMGCTNYDPKKRLDFKFVPMDIYVKLRDRRFNFLTPYICEFMKPENFDPFLKDLYKRASGKQMEISLGLRK